MNGGYEKLVVTTYLHERGITFYTMSQIIIMFINVQRSIIKIENVLELDRVHQSFME